MSPDIVAYNLAGVPTDISIIPLFWMLLVPEKGNRGKFAAMIICAAITNRALSCLGFEWSGLVQIGLLLFACLRYGSGTMGRRLGLFLLGFGFVNVIMIPPTILWVALYDTAPAQIAGEILSHPAYFVFQPLVAALVLVMTWLLGVVMRSAGRRSTLRLDLPALLVLVVQMTWFYPLYVFDNRAFKTTDVLELVLFLLCHAVSLIAALAFLLDASQAAEAREGAARAALLAEAARGYERHYREVERAIARTAALRHDYRNTMQVVAGLAERGEAQTACAMVDDALARTEGEPGPLPVPAAKGSPDAPAARGRIEPSRLALYAANALLGTYMLFFVAPWDRLDAVSKVAYVLAFVAWVGLTPFLVRVVRQAQEVDAARMRVHVAQEMVEARVWYGERVAQELARARELEHELREGLRTARDALAAGGPVGPMPEVASFSGGTHLCENRALDTLVALKARECEEAGIELACTLDVPEEVALSDLELCSIFSNVLDNAIAAAREVPEGERRVQVAAAVRAGMLVVEARNTCAPDAAPRAAARGVADEHGWGLRILSELARSHGGKLEARREGGEFVTHIAVEA